MNTEQQERAVVLLNAACALIEKCDNSPIVLCPTQVTVRYDDADCDGSCLMDDINNLLFELGQ